MPSEAVFSSYLMLFFLYCVQVFLNDFKSVLIDSLIIGINLVVHSIYFSFCFLFGFFRGHIFLKFQCLLTDVFLFHYHGLLLFFVLKDISFSFHSFLPLRWLPYFHDFFPLALIHAMTSVSFQILPLSPFYANSLARGLSRRSSYVLTSTLGRLT